MELFFAVDTITKDGMFRAGTKHIIKDREYAKTLLLLTGVSEVVEHKEKTSVKKKDDTVSTD